MPEETSEVRETRFAFWKSRAFWETMDGETLALPDVFDVLQAVASMENEKATPHGSPPIEPFKALPVHSKVDLAKWYIDYFTNLDIKKPDAWKNCS